MPRLSAIAMRKERITSTDTVTWKTRQEAVNWCVANVMPEIFRKDLALNGPDWELNDRIAAMRNPNHRGTDKYLKFKVSGGKVNLWVDDYPDGTS
jgi:hypothetical protein